MWIHNRTTPPHPHVLTFLHNVHQRRRMTREGMGGEDSGQGVWLLDEKVLGSNPTVCLSVPLSKSPYWNLVLIIWNKSHHEDPLDATIWLMTKLWIVIAWLGSQELKWDKININPNWEIQDLTHLCPDLKQPWIPPKVKNAWNRLELDCVFLTCVLTTSECPSRWGVRVDWSVRTHSL